MSLIQLWRKIGHLFIAIGHLFIAICTIYNKFIKLDRRRKTVNSKNVKIIFKIKHNELGQRRSRGSLDIENDTTCTCAVLIKLPMTNLRKLQGSLLGLTGKFKEH